MTCMRPLPPKTAPVDATERVKLAPRCVYVFLDQHGNPLYAGKTHNLAHRLAGHRRTAAWFPDAVEVTWLPVDKSRSLWHAELYTIMTLKPPHNVQGHTGRSKYADDPEWPYFVLNTVAKWCDSIQMADAA